MQPEFRFLDADERRWIRVAEDCEEAQISERTIGEPGCGNAPVFLLKKYLHGSCFNNDIKIVDAIVK